MCTLCRFNLFVSYNTHVPHMFSHAQLSVHQFLRGPATSYPHKPQANHWCSPREVGPAGCSYGWCCKTPAYPSLPAHSPGHFCSPPLRKVVGPCRGHGRGPQRSLPLPSGSPSYGWHLPPKLNFACLCLLMNVTGYEAT